MQVFTYCITCVTNTNLTPYFWAFHTHAWFNYFNVNKLLFCPSIGIVSTKQQVTCLWPSIFVWWSKILKKQAWHGLVFFHHYVFSLCAWHPLFFVVIIIFSCILYILFYILCINHLWKEIICLSKDILIFVIMQIVLKL